MTKLAWLDFGEETGAALVAGREAYSSVTHFEAVQRAVADHPEATSKPPLVCLPVSDLTEAMDDDEVTFVVGYLAAPVVWADTGPGAVDRAKARAAVAALAALDKAFWTSLDALDPAGESDDLASNEGQLRALPFGPLAGASVAFGVRQNEGKTIDDLSQETDDEDDAADPDDWESRLADIPPSLTRVFGKGTDQRRLPDHVLGLSLGHGGDWSPVEVDLGDEAHAKRVAALTPSGLHTSAGYWLLADYD